MPPVDRRSLVLAPAALAASAATCAAQGAMTRPDLDAASEWFDAVLHWITRLIEIGGITIIVVGAVASTIAYLRQKRTAPPAVDPYRQFRASLGRSILLGLEFLVAADIIGTVAMDPSLDSLAVLAGIVLIRTFLSFSLEVEIEGRWPWQKGEAPRQPPSNSSG
jgi:uncharacterized membrane protein